MTSPLAVEELGGADDARALLGLGGLGGVHEGVGLVDVRDLEQHDDFGRVARQVEQAVDLQARFLLGHGVRVEAKMQYLPTEKTTKPTTKTHTEISAQWRPMAKVVY